MLFLPTTASTSPLSPSLFDVSPSTSKCVDLCCSLSSSLAGEGGTAIAVGLLAATAAAGDDDGEANIVMASLVAGLLLVGEGGMVRFFSSSTLGSSTNDPAWNELWNVAFSSSTVTAKSFRKDRLLGAFVESTVTFPPNMLFERMRINEELSIIGFISVLLLAAAW
eukprot:GDKH01015926.1.p2 GENE.GDKH01015926.1~~GDKH01015926.1.p2  ORF type:complete len:166 (+),score=7.31 GDKH01015926.1:162-659(+)